MDRPEKWYDICMAEPGRLDCPVLAYETPIGITGFRRIDRIPKEVEFYLMLGESNYNLFRTATYATIRILERSFYDYNHMSARVYERHKEYHSALKRMGFSQTGTETDLITVRVEKDVFQSRKYLF